MYSYDYLPCHALLVAGCRDDYAASVARTRLIDALHVTLVHIATDEGVMSVLLAIEEAGLEKRDAQQRTPLLVAAELGCVEVIQMLLEAGAELEVFNERGRSAKTSMMCTV